MLWTVFVILLILWLLGLMTSHTMGGFIHILLVIAIVVVLVRVIQGTKTNVTIWIFAGQSEGPTERSNCYEKEE
jgi:cell division protein FtsW (lipid II flippase)